MPFTNKFCKDCKFYRQPRCGNEGSLRHVDPVDGHTLYESAIAMRANPLMCSEEGIWWTQADPPKTWYERIFG